MALVGAPGFVHHAHDFSTLRDPASQALNFVVYALEVAALGFLFRDDAKAWLGGERPADPSTFD
jgi:hypothetical protein